MSNNVPVLMLRGEDGKFFPVDGITGGSGGTGGGGTGGSTTASKVSYSPGKLVTENYPDVVELEENTVQGGLDWAIAQAIASAYADNIIIKLTGAGGSTDVALQTLFDQVLTPVIQKAHEHDNKSVLDSLTAENGDLKYNGKPAGAPALVTSGTNITLADNTEYRLGTITTLNLTYPVGNFECWMKLGFASTGNITVTFPSDTKYIGAVPTFKNNETWEVSIKDKVVVAQKVGGSSSNAPVKGVDYWTEEDKQEIVNDVIAALPDGTKEVY